MTYDVFQFRNPTTGREVMTVDPHDAANAARLRANPNCTVFEAITARNEWAAMDKARAQLAAQPPPKPLSVRSVKGRS